MLPTSIEVSSGLRVLMLIVAPIASRFGPSWDISMASQLPGYLTPYMRYGQYARISASAKDLRSDG